MARRDPSGGWFRDRGPTATRADIIADPTRPVERRGRSGGRLADDRVAPVVEQVCERLVGRALGLPAGGGAELRGVGDEQRLVDGADPRGVDVDVDRDLSPRGQGVERVGEAGAAAGAEVVDLAG